MPGDATVFAQDFSDRDFVKALIESVPEEGSCRKHMALLLNRAINGHSEWSDLRNLALEPTDHLSLTPSYRLLKTLVPSSVFRVNSRLPIDLEVAQATSARVSLSRSSA